MASASDDSFILNSSNMCRLPENGKARSKNLHQLQISQSAGLACMSRAPPGSYASISAKETDTSREQPASTEEALARQGFAWHGDQP